MVRKLKKIHPPNNMGLMVENSSKTLGCITTRKSHNHIRFLVERSMVKPKNKPHKHVRMDEINTARTLQMTILKLSDKRWIASVLAGLTVAESFATP